MEWIKLYTRKWLYGSGRVMSPEKRGVWIDLLALTAEAKLRDGTLRFDVGKPMPRSWIASTLMIDEDTLDACLTAFKADINADDGLPRVQEWEDGTIVITNWSKYQDKSDKQIAKEVSKEQNKRGRESLTNATQALTREVNEMNINNRESNKTNRAILEQFKKQRPMNLTEEGENNE